MSRAQDQHEYINDNETKLRDEYSPSRRAHGQPQRRRSRTPTCSTSDAYLNVSSFHVTHRLKHSKRTESHQAPSRTQDPVDTLSIKEDRGQRVGGTKRRRYARNQRHKCDKRSKAYERAYEQVQQDKKSMILCSARCKPSIAIEGAWRYENNLIEGL
jgi:hypothetical protein